MRTATPETRKLINQYLHYPENSAGSIMTAEFIDLKKYMSVRESIARIRRIDQLAAAAGRLIQDEIRELSG